MSEGKMSDEELDKCIEWCRSVAFGSFIDKTEVTNKSWHQKFVALTELKELRKREKV